LVALALLICYIFVFYSLYVTYIATNMLHYSTNNR